MSEGLQVDVQFAFPSGFDLDVKVSADAGGVTQLVGPSGSGKSTILSLVAGLLQPHAGFISIYDKTLFCSQQQISVPPWRRKVGLLFQNDTLFPHLSVKQNLCFGNRAKVPHAWTLDSICETFQLSDLLDRRPWQLSGGQRDRVRLGRTLLSQPRVLLLDEPLNSVEATLRQQIFRFVIDGIAQRQVPLVLVSHDAGLRRQAAGQVWLLENGKLRVDSAD